MGGRGGRGSRGTCGADRRRLDLCPLLAPPRAQPRGRAHRAHPLNSAPTWGARLQRLVLQTLALIQRSAVAALARQQERELRGWLVGGDSRDRRHARRRRPRCGGGRGGGGGGRFGRGRGRRRLPARRGVVARGCGCPAMLNAAKFAGEASSSSTPRLPTSAFRSSSAIAVPASTPRPCRRRGACGGTRSSIVRQMRRAGGGRRCTPCLMEAQRSRLRLIVERDRERRIGARVVIVNEITTSSVPACARVSARGSRLFVTAGMWRAPCR